MKHFLGAMMLISCTMHLLVASDWPQFQRDPQHTGRTPDSVPFGSGDTGYRLRWMWQGAAGTIRNKLANPLWDGPTVYPKTPIYDPIRNNIWDQRIPQSVPFTLAGLAQPVVVGERVYIGDQDGKVYCINTDDGSTIWTADNPGGTCGAAAVGNNVAVFTSMTGYVRGYHADNGTLLWTFKTRGPVTVAPVMEGTDIYVACHGRRAYRINMLTGAVVWTSPDLGAQVVQPVALDARSVYTAAENMRAFALNKDDGSIRAQRTVGGSRSMGSGRLYGAVLFSLLRRLFLPSEVNRPMKSSGIPPLFHKSTRIFVRISRGRIRATAGAGSRRTGSISPRFLRMRSRSRSWYQRDLPRVAVHLRYRHQSTTRVIYCCT